MPEQDFIVRPKGSSTVVSLCPAQNIIASLMILHKTNKFYGFNDWVIETAHALTDEERTNNSIVCFGLHHAYSSGRDWTDFPEYLNYLETLDAEKMRERMFARYRRIGFLRNMEGAPGSEEPPTIDEEEILKNLDSFLGYIENNYNVRHVDFEIETQAYQYIINPQAMKELIIGHLRHMWDKYLSTEWGKNETLLRESVNAFKQFNLQNLDRFEAAKLITGQDIIQKIGEWPWKLEWYKNVNKVIFFPSAHVGPYLVKQFTKNTFYIAFGARQPSNVQFQAPNLNRNEINVRLNALADDTRLRVLQLISEKGELSSQEIMTHLGLSQSAASRHLKQLSATGFLVERRQTCAKCYNLNSEFLDNTLDAVSCFLKKKA